MRNHSANQNLLVVQVGDANFFKYAHIYRLEHPLYKNSSDLATFIGTIILAKVALDFGFYKPFPKISHQQPPTAMYYSGSSSEEKSPYLFATSSLGLPKSRRSGSPSASPARPQYAMPPAQRVYPATPGPGINPGTTITELSFAAVPAEEMQGLTGTAHEALNALNALNAAQTVPAAIPGAALTSQGVFQPESDTYEKTDNFDFELGTCEQMQYFLHLLDGNPAAPASVNPTQTVPAAISGVVITSDSELPSFELKVPTSQEIDEMQDIMDQMPEKPFCLNENKKIIRQPKLFKEAEKRWFDLYQFKPNVQSQEFFDFLRTITDEYATENYEPYRQPKTNSLYTTAAEIRLNTQYSVASWQMIDGLDLSVPELDRLGQAAVQNLADFKKKVINVEQFEANRAQLTQQLNAVTSAQLPVLDFVPADQKHHVINAYYHNRCVRGCYGETFLQFGSVYEYHDAHIFSASVGGLNGALNEGTMSSHLHILQTEMHYLLCPAENPAKGPMALLDTVLARSKAHRADRQRTMVNQKVIEQTERHFVLSNCIIAGWDWTDLATVNKAVGGLDVLAEFPQTNPHYVKVNVKTMSDLCSRVSSRFGGAWGYKFAIESGESHESALAHAVVSASVMNRDLHEMCMKKYTETYLTNAKNDGLLASQLQLPVSYLPRPVNPVMPALPIDDLPGGVDVSPILAFNPLKKDGNLKK